MKSSKIKTKKIKTNNRRGGNQSSPVNLPSSVIAAPVPVSDLCLSIKEKYRTRVDFLSAENRQLAQIKAICRRICGFNPVAPKAEKQSALLAAKRMFKEKPVKLLQAAMPLLDALDILHRYRLEAEKELLAVVRKFPVHKWSMNIRGFGEINLANIIGEAGDLSNYATVAKLWKRFGVAVMAGHCQKRTKNKELAIAMGYSPRRRAVLFNLGACLVKGNKDGKDGPDGPYRALYLKRKEIERKKAEAAGIKMTKKHIDNRARRYMEKRVLRDLWKAWRRAS
jgi:hypothetical protein